MSTGRIQFAEQDGGDLRDHVMTEMPGELWKDFQREFLDQKDI